MTKPWKSENRSPCLLLWRRMPCRWTLRHLPVLIALLRRRRMQVVGAPPTSLFLFVCFVFILFCLFCFVSNRLLSLFCISLAVVLFLLFLWFVVRGFCLFVFVLPVFFSFVPFKVQEYSIHIHLPLWPLPVLYQMSNNTISYLLYHCVVTQGRLVQ